MIELHDETGRAVFVSAHHITALLPNHQLGPRLDGCTIVCLSSGRSITVTESITDIAAWIPSARRDA